MTLSEVAPLQTATLPAEFSELREQPEHFIYLPIGQDAASELPAQSDTILALGIYAFHRPEELTPAEVMRHGLPTQSAERVQIFGQALLRNHETTVAHSQRRHGLLPHLEAMAIGIHRRRVAKAACRYVDGRRESRTALMGGYLLTAGEDGHGAGVFINNKIMPSVRLGIEDVQLNYQDYYSRHRRHPSPSHSLQVRAIPWEQDKSARRSFEETIASLVIASRIKLGLEVLQAAQPAAESTPGAPPVDTHVIALPVARAA